MAQIQVSDYIRDNVSDDNLLAFREKIAQWDGSPYSSVRYAFYDKDVLYMLHKEVKEDN